MNNKSVEARISKREGGVIDLLIRVGDSVVKATYSELAACAFPVWTSTPIHVEIPLDGQRSSISAGMGLDEDVLKDIDGGFPNIIKFPVYHQQANSTIEEFESLSDISPKQTGTGSIISREPLVTVGISALGLMAGTKHVETHSVLPIWADGMSVIVTMNWCENEHAEGSPNPEWHLHSSKGMPLEEGMRRLMNTNLLSENVTNCVYRINISPWKLGANILGNAGKETQHQIWQREWKFTNNNEFQIALGRLHDSILCRMGEQSIA